MLVPLDGSKFAYEVRQAEAAARRHEEALTRTAEF